MKLTFISRYGSKNIGDELIVRELEKLLLQHTKNIERFDFNLNHYESLDSAFNHKIQQNNIKNRTKISTNLYRKYVREFFIVGRIRNYINKKRARRNINLKYYREKLTKSHALIIGGGNAIFDTERLSSSYYYFDLKIKEAKKMKLPIIILNIGVGPFQTKKQLKKSIKVMNKADYITVRDDKSYNLLKKINKKEKKLFKTVDPVLFLENIKKQPVKEVKHIGFNIMDLRLANYSEEEYRQYINSFKSVLIFMNNHKNYKLTVFCTEEKDLNALNDLIIKLKRESSFNNINFINSTSLKNVLSIYEEIDVLLGTRMHSNIISFSQSIPFVGINWQSKVVGFFNNINNKKNLLEMNEFNYNYKIAVNQIDYIISNYAFESKKIEEKRKENLSNYEINKIILKRICK